MPKVKEPANPFYVLLVFAGVVFLVTACAYGLMAARATRPITARATGVQHAIEVRRDAPDGGHPLMTFLDRHGAEMLTWELIFLGCTTAAAMALDERRTRRRATGDRAGSSEADEAKIR